MTSISIEFKDGSIREFPHQGRAGGSYTKRIRYEGGFVIISDEWGKEVAFPVELVKSVTSTPEVRW